jgi:quercetin dioxygenase-like cupin family protein
MDIQNLDGIVEKEIFPGCKGKFIHTGNITFAYWDILESALLPRHSHPNEQITHLVEGEYEFKVGDETRILRPGDVLVIPSNVEHSGRPLTRCKIIDVFYPAREDYKDS